MSNWPIPYWYKLPNNAEIEKIAVESTNIETPALAPQIQQPASLHWRPAQRAADARESPAVVWLISPLIVCDRSIADSFKICWYCHGNNRRLFIGKSQMRYPGSFCLQPIETPITTDGINFRLLMEGKRLLKKFGLFHQHYPYTISLSRELLNT